MIYLWCPHHGYYKLNNEERKNIQLSKLTTCINCGEECYLMLAVERPASSISQHVIEFNRIHMYELERLNFDERIFPMNISEVERELHRKLHNWS